MSSDPAPPRQMTREEILAQLPDDFDKISSLKGLVVGPPPTEDFMPGEIPAKQTFVDKMSTNFRRNPFVPVGMLVTTFFLANGLRHSLQSNSWKSQGMMRGRVAAQGFTILALMGGIVWETRKRVSSTKEKT